MQLHEYLKTKLKTLSTDEKYIIIVILKRHGYGKKEACEAMEVNSSNYARIEQHVDVRRETYEDAKEFYDKLEKKTKRYFKNLTLENKSAEKLIKSIVK